MKLETQISKVSVLIILCRQLTFIQSSAYDVVMSSPITRIVRLENLTAHRRKTAGVRAVLCPVACKRICKHAPLHVIFMRP